jgi:hypothetical protein
VADPGAVARSGAGDELALNVSVLLVGIGRLSAAEMWKVHSSEVKAFGAADRADLGTAVRHGIRIHETRGRHEHGQRDPGYQEARLVLSYSPALRGAEPVKEASCAHDR